MMYSKMPIEKLIEQKVQKNVNGCWNWKGNSCSNGYGLISYGGGGRDRTTAHRFFYEKFNGKIKDGMHIDHICKNRICVNPEHLRQLTPKNNVLCGDGLSAKNLRKTHCNNGHELSGENLGIVKGKYGYQRRCKECLKNWTKLKARQKQRLLKLASKFVDDFTSIKNEWSSYVKSNNY